MFTNDTFINKFWIDRIKAEAQQELAGGDDAALGQLWNRVYAAFDQWKQEHGNRKPKAFRGMLSDLVGAKSIPFKKAAPWQCSDFTTPSPVTLAVKLLQERYAPFETIMDEAGIRKVLALAIVKSEYASDDDLLVAGEILRDHANIKIGVRAGFDAAGEQTKKNLAEGRKLGVIARQDEAAKKKAALIGAIKGLFDKPEKPGWGWTNPEIVTFLKKSNCGYAESTLMVTVKAEAAKYRKARKEEQASKYLKR